MKKRIFYVLCLMMVLLVMTACGKKADNTGEKEEKTEKAAMDFSDRENVKTNLFTVYYPKDWKYDADNMSNEDGFCRVLFYIGESSSDAQKTVTVLAQEEKAKTFRQELLKNGIAMEDYANGSAESATFGEVKYAVSTNDDSEDVNYLYRHEASGISYMLIVDGEKEDASVKELLEGVQLELKDTGNEEAPWPWEGEPITPQLKEQKIGKYTIVPTQVPFEESNAVTGIMDHQFVKTGNTLYHLYKNTLNKYEYNASGLKFVSTMELDDEYEHLSTDKSGMLYLSPGLSPVIGIKNDKQVLQTDVNGYLAMHPDGKWGISYWVATDTQKITNKNGELTSEPWILTGINDDSKRKGIFKMVDEVEVTDSHIMVSGTEAAENGNVKVAIYDAKGYDTKGKQPMVLGSNEIGEPDSLGSITGMVETENGFVAADGNMRKIIFWTKKGKVVGAVDVKEMFGTDYPWLEDMQLLEDGSILVALTQERDDDSSDELMFFRLTGF